MRKKYFDITLLDNIILMMYLFPPMELLKRQNSDCILIYKSYTKVNLWIFNSNFNHLNKIIPH